MAVLGKALDLLETVATLDRVSMQELTGRTGLPKSTLFRLVVTLEHRGYLQRQGRSGDLELGPRALFLSERSRRVGADLRSRARPVMLEIRDRLRHTVNLGVLRGNRLFYLEVVEGTTPLRFVDVPGDSGPLHATALGKAILAHMPEDAVRKALGPEPFRRFTPNTITEWRPFLAELERVRQQEHALDSQESVFGAVCVATPIFDREGHVIAALSISAPDIQFGGEDRTLAVQLLKRASERISAAL